MDQYEDAQKISITRKREYLEIFTLLATGKYKKLHDTKSLHEAANELAAAGFLECFIPEIRPGYFLGTWKLTYLGYIELARLEREIYLQSWRYKLKNIGWQSLTFIVGALVSALVGYLFR